MFNIFPFNLLKFNFKPNVLDWGLTKVIIDVADIEDFGTSNRAEYIFVSLMVTFVLMLIGLLGLLIIGLILEVLAPLLYFITIENMHFTLIALFLLAGNYITRVLDAIIERDNNEVESRSA